MKRTLLSLFLALCMVFSLAACSIPGATVTPCQHRDKDDDNLCDKCDEPYTDGKDVVYSKGLKFVSNGDGTCYVSSIGGCTDNELVIPVISPSGNNVTSIGEKAFYNCDNITSVVIPDSVTTIGNYAFYQCYSLKSVVIGDSVTSIGDSAFSYCDSLKNVVIPDSVTSIGSHAFSYCDSLKNVMIGDNVTSIGEWAFVACDSLTSVMIGDSVTSIGSHAFGNCDSLTSVVITDSVTSIGDETFAFCDSLASIIVSEGNTAYQSIDGNLYTKDGKMLIQYAIGKTDTSVEIPNGVEIIGSYAFEWCYSLKSVVIPDSVRTIGNFAFDDCDSLTSVVIGDSVRTIGYKAFAYCKKLTSIKYRGTQSQWNAISKESYWRSDTGSCTITYNYTGK